MTTLVPARLNGRGDPSPRPEPEDTQTGQRGGWFARHPDWPIATYLIAFPLWWGLGVVDYMPVVLAIPMLHRMYQWRATRSRSIRVPPGFGIWLVFLIVMLAGITTISQTAPVTIASPSGTRMISYALRSADYLAVTVMLLYAGNLTERELSRKRLAWWMGLLGIYTLVGGLGGIVNPRFQFTAPISVLVPKSLQATNGQLQVMLHPGFSEVQGILGYSVGLPRPRSTTRTRGETRSPSCCRGCSWPGGHMARAGSAGPSWSCSPSRPYPPRTPWTGACGWAWRSASATWPSATRPGGNWPCWPGSAA